MAYEKERLLGFLDLDSWKDGIAIYWNEYSSRKSRVYQDHGFGGNKFQTFYIEVEMSNRPLDIWVWSWEESSMVEL